MEGRRRKTFSTLGEVGKETVTPLRTKPRLTLPIQGLSPHKKDFFVDITSRKSQLKVRYLGGLQDDSEDDAKHCSFCRMRDVDGKVLRCPIHGHTVVRHRLPSSSQLMNNANKGSIRFDDSDALRKNQMLSLYLEEQRQKRGAALLNGAGRDLILARVTERKRAEEAAQANTAAKKGANSKRNRKRRKQYQSKSVQNGSDVAVSHDVPQMKTAAPVLVRRRSVAAMVESLRATIDRQGVRDSEVRRPSLNSLPPQPASNHSGTSLSGEARQNRAQRLADLHRESSQLLRLSSAVSSAVSSGRKLGKLVMTSGQRMSGGLVESGRRRRTDSALLL